MAGFCSLWIPGFGILAKLYEFARGPDEEPLKWDKEQEGVFQQLKTKLSLALALALPNLEKPFTLFAAVRQGQVLGVLTQK